MFFREKVYFFWSYAEIYATINQKEGDEYEKFNR